MKTIRTVILMMFIIDALSLSLPHEAFSETVSVVGQTPFQEILDSVKTPKKLAKYMKKHFKFKEDERVFGKSDYWQSPDEFLKRGVGDCEDYALFSQKILSEMGYEAFVISFYGDYGYAHTVTVYKDKKGRFRVINQDKHKRYKEKSMEKLLSKINPLWRWGAIAERKGTVGHSQKLLFNKDYRPDNSFRANFRDFPF